MEPDGLCHELAVPGHNIVEDSGLREGKDGRHGRSYAAVGGDRHNWSPLIF